MTKKKLLPDRFGATTTFLKLDSKNDFEFTKSVTECPFFSKPLILFLKKVSEYPGVDGKMIPIFINFLNLKHHHISASFRKSCFQNYAAFQ